MQRLLIGCGLLFGTLLLGLIGYLGILLAGDYVIDEKKLVMNSTTQIVDLNGEVLQKLFIENREIISIDNVPDHVQEAFISVEDERFYKHHGLDLIAISRALYKDILAGSKVEGGSTITQQLAKNIFLTNEKSWLRKTKEAIISINLERSYSKPKLLEMYLNQIYFGHGAYGIQAASELYFNKKVFDLSVEEGAILAAIPKAPSTYSPINNPEKSKSRRDIVLNLMHSNGFISADQAVRLQGKTIAIDSNRFGKNPAFITYIDMVMDEAKEKYHLSNEELYRGGYKIVVPINENLQQNMYNLFKESTYFAGTNDQVEAASILMDSNSGGVLAVQGGRNYVHKGINRVNVKRQPGSTLKPLVVYGPALENGYSPYTLLKDEKLSYGDYTPANYNDIYQGKVTLYDALRDSVNTSAVWLLNEIGVDVGKQYLDNADIQIKDRGLAVALGGLTNGVSPIQMAKAYRAFLEEGQTIEPFFIESIYDSNGELVGKAEPVQRQVFSRQTAWYMTRMLEAVVNEGTGRAGEYGGALAGKTGTTSYTGVKGASKDAWFVGYTPQIVGSVWIGYDKTSQTQYLQQGSSNAVRLFKDIIKPVATSNLAFVIPANVEDLAPPIRLNNISDLTANVSFKPFRFFTVDLSWTPDEDNRVEYRVYMKNSSEEKYLGNVTGEGKYTIDVNVFKEPSFYVVPYNRQTEQEGKSSNIATISLFSR